MAYVLAMETMRRVGIRTPIAVFAIILVISATALWQLSKARCLQMVGEVTCGIETDSKIVALTFDDGPHRKVSTPFWPSWDHAALPPPFSLSATGWRNSPGKPSD